MSRTTPNFAHTKVVILMSQPFSQNYLLCCHYFALSALFAHLVRRQLRNWPRYGPSTIYIQSRYFTLAAHFLRTCTLCDTLRMFQILPHFAQLVWQVLVALCVTTPLSSRSHTTHCTFHNTLLLRTRIFFRNHITSWPILGVCAHCNSFGRFCERLLCTVPALGTYHDFLFLSCDICLISLVL